MEAKQVLIPVGVLGVVTVIYLYLRGSNEPALIQYPNAAGGGLPNYKPVGTVYNLGSRTMAPSPSIALGPLPPMPPAPSYQKVNYSPINIFGMTPAAAELATAKEKKKDDC